MTRVLTVFLPISAICLPSNALIVSSTSQSSLASTRTAILYTAQIGVIPLP